MGKAEQNKQNKRASLLQAAFDLFLNQGFHDTTISDISKKSGLAKGTFYLYFKDKYDLRDQLIARKSEQLLQEASEYTKTSLPAQTGFEEYLLSMIDYILHYLQNNKMLLRFISKNLSWANLIMEVLSLSIIKYLSDLCTISMYVQEVVLSSLNLILITDSAFKNSAMESLQNRVIPSSSTIISPSNCRSIP